MIKNNDGDHDSDVLSIVDFSRAVRTGCPRNGASCEEETKHSKLGGERKGGRFFSKKGGETLTDRA